MTFSRFEEFHDALPSYSKQQETKSMKEAGSETKTDEIFSFSNINISNGEAKELVDEIRVAEVDLMMYNDEKVERFARNNIHLQKEIYDSIKRYRALHLRLKQTVTEEEYRELMREDSSEETPEPVLKQTDLLDWGNDVEEE